MTRKYVRMAVPVVALLLMGLAGAVVYAKATAGPGQIELSATQLDWGSVPNTGPVSRDFQVRNGGRGWLDITGVSTSCGCTTAEVASLHLAPGESTTLHVTFDPLVHNGETGKFMRVVYVRSSDPKTPEANLTFWVTVVAAQPGAGANG